MNSQFVMAINIVRIQIKINSLMAKVLIIKTISKSLGSSSMPGIMLSALHGLTLLLFTVCPREIAIIPILQMKKLRQRAIMECAQ